MLLSLRKSGLTSLFKEVRAFKVLESLEASCPFLVPLPSSLIDSVHTRGIVKTSGFTRGVCKND